MRSRVKEIVRADLEDILDVDVATIAEYKGLVRSTFSLVDRPPLCFPSNSHGMDAQGGSLVHIQRRNAPRGFDLLRGELYQLVDDARGLRLWSDYHDDLEFALSVFEQAREMLAPLRRVVVPSRDDPQWTAVATRAARAVLFQRKPIFQYADRFGSLLSSARKFWPELKPLAKWKWKSETLADHEVFAILAANEARRSVEAVVGLLRRFDELADDRGVSDDDEEGFRDEVCRWEREESRHARRLVYQAKDLLRRAELKSNESDYAERLEGEIQRREKQMNEVAPMVRRGEAFTHPPRRGLSPFYAFVLELLIKHGRDTSAKKLWKLLKDEEGKGVIDEISDDAVYLRGKDAPTKFKAFQTHLGEIRKKVRG